MLDDSKLYWCIDEINVSRIQRGMSKDSLATLFGESLHFEDGNRTARCLLTVPKKSGVLMQLPAPWEVQFSLDENGIVDDFVITRGRGK